MQSSDEIKSKLDIIDVIQEYIQLKPAGVNFRALCPFHREKSPSFVVSPEKQIWHCFGGCGKGGDIFSFIMEMEGVNFVEALRILAQKAGVVLQKQDPKIISQRNRILDILEFSVDYYNQMLFKNNNASKIKKYLFERGLTEDTIREWKIGYSPESWDDVINVLKNQKYSESEIFSAGLSVKKEGINRFYNRFRNRIMFPICDANGVVVGFSARVNPEKEQEEKLGKYINTPQTAVYDKSKILFGLDKAKTTIRNEKTVIIVEGQMDVITAHQHGFKNVIASSGTALTSEQIKLIKRWTNNISLAFDMDAAGQMAADRGIKEAMAQEMNIKIIIIPSGKDPDECIKNNPDEWKKAVENAQQFMQYYFDKIFAGLDLEKIENRREGAKNLLSIIIKLENKIEQDFWLKKLSAKIDVNESILRETINQAIPRNAKKIYQENTPKNNDINSLKSREEKLSELLLALIIKFSALIEYVVDHIDTDHIIGFENKEIYKNLIIYYNDMKEVNYNKFQNWLKNKSDNSQLAILDKLVLLGDKDFYNIDAEQAKQEIIKINLDLKKYYLTNSMKAIEKLIIKSEKEKDGEGVKELMQELKTLSDEMGNIY